MTVTSRLTIPNVLGAASVLRATDPTFEHRPPQERFSLAEDYLLSLPAGGRIVAELPTGSGKSRGALVPPLLADGPLKVLYSTGTKGLQGQLHGQDVPYLDRHLGAPRLGRRIRSAVLKGFDNYACLRNLSDLEGPGGVAFETAEAHAQYTAVEPWLRTTATGDLDEAPVVLGPELRARLTTDADGCDHRACPFYERCYVTRARAAAAAPDVIAIINHSLLIHHARLWHRSGGKAGVLGFRPDVLILDEVHRLADITREALSEAIGFGYGRTRRSRVRRLIADTDVETDAEALALDLQDRLDAWATALVPRVRAAAQRTGRAELLLGDERAHGGPAAEAAEALAAACQDAGQQLERAAAQATVDDEEDEATALLLGAQRWRRQADAAGHFAGVVHQVATPPGNEIEAGGFLRRALLEGNDGERLRCTWTPVDVSAALTTLIWDGTLAPVVVGMSATLATAATGPQRLAYFKQEAGVPQGTAERPTLELIEDSAFDWPARSRLYISPPAAILADRRQDRQAFDAQLAAEVGRVLRATGGRALVLFTSVASMTAVAAHVAPLLPPAWQLFVQGGTPRSAILAAFNAPERPPVVAFVTRGYWEGVDIRGLDAVVIDRLPFTPPDDPLHAARRRLAERLTGDRWAGWERISFPEMVLHLRQGVGRLLRTRTDRGVVAILDARLVTSGYGRHVVAALPPMPRVRSVQELQTFSRRQP